MKGYLHGNDVLQLLPLLDETSLSIYARSLIVSMLAHTDASISVEIQDTLRHWAADRADWLGWTSLEFFARKGLLQTDQKLLEAIGIRKAGETYQVGNITRIGAFIVGLLHESAPDEWRTVISEFLRVGTWENAYPIIRALQDAHSTGISIDNDIQDALLERTFRRTGQFYAEPQLLVVVARLFPQIFINKMIEQSLQQWLPEARLAAVKGCSAATEKDPSISEQAITFLVQMCGDSSLRVRRAALSTVARLSQSSTNDLCSAMSASKICDVRQRAAEAAAWIEDDNTFSGISQTLISDKDPRVRKEMIEARLSRRNREWSNLYFAKIKEETHEAGRDTMLKLWKYGTALVRLGNEDVLSELKEFHFEKDWLPWQEHWIQDLITDLEKRVTDELSKKAEQWTPEEASLERLSGEITINNHRLALPRILVWISSQGTPFDKSSWGGSARLTGLDVLPILMSQPDECKVSLKDGRTGSALIRQFSQDYILFVGNGPFG